MKKEKKAVNRNRGFSLVELIIVIAIMAVLIGVLAPQFVKYIERSRKSADVQNVGEIIHAVEVYSMNEVNQPYVVNDTFDISNTEVVPNPSGGLVDRAMIDAGLESIKLKSKDWTDPKGGTLTLEVDVVGDPGKIGFTLTNQRAGVDLLAGKF